MRITLALLLLSGALASCKKEPTPPGVLNHEQMANWMMAIYLAEARTVGLKTSRDSAFRLFVPFQDSLMSRKGINDSTLRKSYQYYLDHPAELEIIYDAVIDSLSLLEQQTRPLPEGSR